MPATAADPCPFCGKPVTCDYCARDPEDAHGHQIQIDCATEGEAVSRWNRIARNVRMGNEILSVARAMIGGGSSDAAIDERISALVLDFLRSEYTDG